MSTGELVSAVRPTSGLAREGPGRSQRAFVNDTSPASCSEAALKHLRCAFFWLLASVLDAASSLFLCLGFHGARAQCVRLQLHQYYAIHHTRAVFRYV